MSVSRQLSLRLALVTVVGLVPWTAAAEGVDDLPVAVEVRVIKSGEQELARVERVLKAQRGIDPASANNVTIKLQNHVEDELGNGFVTIYPRAVFQVCLLGLREHRAKQQLAELLVEYQRSGRFARIARGDEPMGSTPPSGRAP